MVPPNGTQAPTAPNFKYAKISIHTVLNVYPGNENYVKTTNYVIVLDRISSCEIKCTSANSLLNVGPSPRLYLQVNFNFDVHVLVELETTDHFRFVGGHKNFSNVLTQCVYGVYICICVQTQNP